MDAEDCPKRCRKHSAPCQRFKGHRPPHAHGIFIDDQRSSLFHSWWLQSLLPP